jgi:hypothetical protein
MQTQGHIAFARRIDVNTLIFDNVDELRNVKSVIPDQIYFSTFGRTTLRHNAN